MAIIGLRAQITAPHVSAFIPFSSDLSGISRSQSCLVSMLAIAGGEASGECMVCILDLADDFVCGHRFKLLMPIE